jgi:hypothetical protein
VSASTPSLFASGDTNTGIFFPAADTIAFAEGGAEIARFDSSGNLGIGKSTITAKLDVQTTSGTTEPIGRFEAAVGSYTGTSLIAANTLGASSTYNLFSCITDSDGDAGGPVTEFLVRGDGNVGIGTTSTNFGGVDFKQAISASNYLMAMNTSSSSADMVNFYTTSGFAGKISSSTTTTTYTTSSDYRLKENIALMSGALEKIQALKPVTYTWKENNVASQGFIAHELQEIIPECVVGKKDAVDTDGNPQYQGIDTSFLVATLTAAIQELKALTDTQASTITALTARITALENK